MSQNYHTFQVHYKASLDAGDYHDATGSMFSDYYYGWFLDTPKTRSPEAGYMWPNDTTTQIPARNIIFGSAGPLNYYVTTCQITIPYVDAQVLCTRADAQSGAACATTALRESTAPHLSSNWTEIDLAVYWYMLDALPSIFGTQHSGTSTPTEAFLYDPPSAFTSFETGATQVAMGKVPIEVFQKRLSLVFNTFWRSTVLPGTVYGGSVNASLFPEAEIMLNTTGKWNYLTEPVYKISIPWIVTYFTATFIQVVCVILTIILRYHLCIPEILGYVSALTRDSPYVAVPPGGSTLNDDERAWLLKDCWVRIQDVQPNQNVGRIAFSSDQSATAYSLGRGRFWE
jgi:hypothetical protein